MKYKGSKRRIGRELFEVIKQHSGLNDGNWVEPFVGGANMIKYVQGDIFGDWVRYANDYNKYVVACLKSYADGWTIPYNEISEAEYKDMRKDWQQQSGKYKDEILGFAGICCAFGSDWFHGYAKDKVGNNYTLMGHNNLIKQAKFLQKIMWSTGSYSNMGLPSPDNTIIYCDPPYNNTSGYGEKFDHDAFYQWVRDKARQGYKMYISEYSMPADFELIHKIIISCDIDKTATDKNTQRVEKLYTFNA